MSKRLRNTHTGAVVSVRDDKVLGGEWVPVVVASATTEEPKRGPGRPKKSDEK